jgi:hypothetical protein
VVNQTDLNRAVWHKSSRSGGYSENCVEVAGLDVAVAVRDSKDPEGPALVFRAAAWRAFASAAKRGTYDR